MNDRKNRVLALLSSDKPQAEETRWLAGEMDVAASVLRDGLMHRRLFSQSELDKLQEIFGISRIEAELAMGIVSRELLATLSKSASAVCSVLPESSIPAKPQCPPRQFQTLLGELYQGDCLDLMPNLPEESVDLIFADPPFNLKKLYPSGISDNLRQEEYLKWCERWAEECIRLLKPGGSLFIWNLPKWNTYMSNFLNDRLTFRHWISCDIKYSLPIQGRLYPSHYSLLYYCKGDKPKTFSPDRLQMPICPHCYGDLRDYGGYKHKMNPKGINLPDVWTDIPPVRHAKYKKRNGANELSLKLLDRIVEMASIEGDVVFDPFGGSGTTYVAAELKNRRWIGCELDELHHIKNRFSDLDPDRSYLTKIRQGVNKLFSEDALRQRSLLGMWTPTSVRERKQAELALGDTH